MTKGTKHPSPLRIDMDPDEFLERAIRTKPSEVEALIKRGKQNKPPGTKRLSNLWLPCEEYTAAQLVETFLA